MNYFDGEIVKYLSESSSIVDEDAFSHLRAEEKYPYHCDLLNTTPKPTYFPIRKLDNLYNLPYAYNATYEGLLALRRHMEFVGSRLLSHRGKFVYIDVAYFDDVCRELLKSLEDDKEQETIRVLRKSIEDKGREIQNLHSVIDSGNTNHKSLLVEIKDKDSQIHTLQNKLIENETSDGIVCDVEFWRKQKADLQKFKFLTKCLSVSAGIWFVLALLAFFIR